MYVFVLYRDLLYVRREEIPFSVCEKLNEASAMLTPAEIISLRVKTVACAKRIFHMGKRIATLEARVTKLEELLSTQPADACPYCGERSLRMSHAGHVRGSPPNAWRYETWACGKCGRQDQRAKQF